MILKKILMQDIGLFGVYGVMFLSILLFQSTSLMAAESLQSKAREYFFLAGKESCMARDLLEITGKDSSDRGVIYAYKGAAYTMIADCVKSPIQKMKNFNLGKEIIDEAIANDPTSAEIRFIRIMVQNGAPAFLNYNNLQEDMKVFITTILKKSQQQSLDEFEKKMAKALLSTDVPENEQKASLNSLIEK